MLHLDCKSSESMDVGRKGLFILRVSLFSLAFGVSHGCVSQPAEDPETEKSRSTLNDKEASQVEINTKPKIQTAEMDAEDVNRKVLIPQPRATLAQRSSKSVSLVDEKWNHHFPKTVIEGLVTSTQSELVPTGKQEKQLEIVTRYIVDVQNFWGNDPGETVEFWLLAVANG